MAPLACAYPTVLTNKDWQKKKGLAGKTKSSGVGEKLIELEKAFAKTAFGELDPAALAAETLDPLTIKKKLAALDKSLAGQAKALSALIKRVDTTLAKAIPLFAGSSSTKSVATHLGTMRTELDKFETVLMTTYPKALKAEITQEYATALKQAKGYLYLRPAAAECEQMTNRLLAEIKQVEAAGSLAMVHQLWLSGTTTPPRKITTWFKMWDQIIAKDFPELTKAAGYDKKAMTNLFPLPWMAQVADENVSTATKKLQALIDAGQSEEKVMQKFCLEYSRSVLESRTLIAAMVKTWAVLAKF